MKNKRDIEFLFEIGSTRNLQRGWRQHLGVDCADDLEHTVRVIWLALIIARKEKIKNEEKIIKMALIHDVEETRTSDLSYVQKVYVKADGEHAAKDLFYGTILNDFYKSIFKEYEERKSIESKIVKDADNLDIDLELKELEERGSQMRKKWAPFRKKVRYEKLYTKAAKEIWDDIQKADVSSWHLAANKWLKIKRAGK
ncbi:MAG: HD domain-containing protein [Candidatus Pacebacteria bacterium]|nr:HD domain-containing protein [Candidatus Paceibacterota bacterium]